MSAFFIGCVIFLLLAWILLSADHGKALGETILEIICEFLHGKGDDK